MNHAAHAPQPLSRLTASPWLIVASGYLIGLLTSGLLAYTRGSFLVPIAEEIGSSRLELSLGFTIASAATAISAPIAGYLLDRYPVRRIALLLALWTSVGYFALAAIDGKLGLFIVMGLCFGLATYHLGGPTPAKLIVEWFDARRGLALSLISMGASTAGVLTPPIATALIESIGWRMTLVSFGVMIMTVVVPLVLLTMRNAPHRGDRATMAAPAVQTTQATPDINVEGDAAARAAIPLSVDRAWRRGEYLRNPNFWAVVIIFGTMGCIFSGVTLHLFPHTTDLGIDSIRASFIVSAMALMALISKPLFGWLVDHFDPRISVAVALLTQTGGVALLLFGATYPAILLAAAAFGTGYGGMVPLRNALTAITFGRQSFGEVSGAMRTSMAPLTMSGMPLAGWIFDTTGSYAVAFTVFIGLYLVAIAAIALLRFRAA